MTTAISKRLEDTLRELDDPVPLFFAYNPKIGCRTLPRTGAFGEGVAETMTAYMLRKLKIELRKRFQTEHVESERSGHEGRYRIAVVSPLFKGMPRLTRQDKVWEVVDEVLPREATLDISLIFTYAPDEIEHAA